MWNFVNTMGHPGHVMGPYNQKRDFSIHIQSVPIVPGKTFTNPNFVNKHHPSVHNYQNNFILSSVSRIGSSNLNCSKHNTNSALINSSQSIADKVKENNIKGKIVKSDPDVIVNIEPATMCHNRKRNKRSRRHRRQKNPPKNSKQNINKQLLNDIMNTDIDLESSINVSDISVSPKIQSHNFHLIDFITEKPNKSTFVKDEIDQYDSDDEELIAAVSAAVVSISPPNVSRLCIRERQLSITESEDSFIVFDDGTDQELEFSEESEDETESQEDELDSLSSVIPHKRVRFADDNELCEIHPMVQWSYAYQQARKGPWEEYARDRDRFSKRIMKTEKILSPIFDTKHRERVYQDRFKDQVDIPYTLK